MNSIVFRLLDLGIGLIGLFLTIPIMFFITLVYVFIGGKPFFLQSRLGQNQVVFTIIKFRSMALNTATVKTHLANPEDVTTFGSLLRRTKLDELPQLINVLKGDMSLVGPRPGLPADITLKNLRQAQGVFDVRPGITGLSQIRGVDMSKPELLAKTDALMIEEISVSKYFKYIILTLFGAGIGDRINK